MCETHVRNSDVRRSSQRVQRCRQRRREADADEGSSSSGSSVGGDNSSCSVDASRDGRSGSNADSDGESEEPEEAEAPLNFAKDGRNSATSSYLAKVLGPVAEYGADFELFQFVYDLWLWSNLGGKKNAVQGQPLRLAMGGYSFSPECWHTRHAALVDVVKQIGLPALFVTVAPYEWSFPDHAWVVDEMTKQFRSKLHLPVAETLHIAHVLAQTVVGLMTGANMTGKDGIGRPGAATSSQPRTAREPRRS